MLLKTKDGNVRYYCEKCCNDEKIILNNVRFVMNILNLMKLVIRLIYEDCMNKIDF